MTTVRANAGPPGIALIKRGMGRLSNGDFVMLYVDSNPVGKGDGSGIRKIYIYHADFDTPDTWVLKNTITPTTALGSNSHISLAVDEDDNLHIGFIAGDGTVRYYYLSLVSSGPYSWNVDSQQTVSTSITHRALDIDVLSAGVAIIGTHLFVTSGSNIFRSYIRRSSDLSWVQLTDEIINTSNPQTVTGNVGNVTVCRDTTPAVSNEMYFAYCVKKWGSPDPGDVLRYKKVNISTGAQISDSAVPAGTGLSVGQNNPNRNYMLFSLGDNKFLLCFVYGNSLSSFNMSFWAFNRSNITSLSTYSKSSYGATTPNLTSFICTEKAVGVLRQTRKFEDFGLYTYSITAAMFSLSSEGGVSDLNVDYKFDGRFNYQPTFIYSGANRNNMTDTRRGVACGHFTDNSAVADSNDPVSAPIMIYPANGSTTNDVTPFMQIDRSGVASKAEWELARDAGFSLSLRTIQDDVYQSSAIYADEYVPSVSALFSGLWYVRAREVDPFQLAGAYSSTIQFNVSYPGTTTNHSPTGNQYRDWGVDGSTLFSWVYSSTAIDSVDSMTAYQIIVERNDDGSVIVDTGKVVSSNSNAELSISDMYKDVQLRWKIRVWNSGDEVGLYSGYQLFYVGDKPTVTITAPLDGATVDNPQPTFTWDFSSGGNRIQQSFRVVINQAPDIVHDSGWINSTSNSYQPGSPVLINEQDYTVAVFVRETGNLENNSEINFSTEWQAPLAPSAVLVSGFNFDTLGSISIQWNDEAIRDATFSEYRIYKRASKSFAWKLIGVYGGSVATTGSFLYYLAPANVTNEYSVVQVATRFGIQVESEYKAVSFTAIGTQYWLVDPDDPSDSLLLYNVIDEGFSEEYESATLEIIGRGRKVDSGTRYGYAGTLSAQIRTRDSKSAREQRLELELLKAKKKAVYLRNPFGDLFLVWLNDISYARIAGVSVQEFVDVTIPYLEVAD